MQLVAKYTENIHVLSVWKVRQKEKNYTSPFIMECQAETTPFLAVEIHIIVRDMLQNTHEPEERQCTLYAADHYSVPRCDVQCTLSVKTHSQSHHCHWHPHRRHTSGACHCAWFSSTHPTMCFQVVCMVMHSVRSGKPQPTESQRRSMHVTGASGPV
ncbi:hypothetical protein M404DRAFT_927022 [Pisolithus tinctorius Marx 270]|uniref:Uncharacterized protein n=1 Tax=Pisolithus tinctorius Marx 270 TaxID=870435 RepID=A0A0C3II77_PISTI|nr:hypothetical protein M404DRAFT_927022 [Pisolithus tinctorius Marx 270]